MKDFHLNFDVTFPCLAPEGGNANGETLARREEARAIVARGEEVEVELSIRYDPRHAFSPLRNLTTQGDALEAEFGGGARHVRREWSDAGHCFVNRWVLGPARAAA